MRKGKGLAKGAAGKWSLGQGGETGRGATAGPVDRLGWLELLQWQPLLGVPAAPGSRASLLLCQLCHCHCQEHHPCSEWGPPHGSETTDCGVPRVVRAAAAFRVGLFSACGGLSQQPHLLHP